jgi:hypothetical protein
MGQHRNENQYHPAKSCAKCQSIALYCAFEFEYKKHIRHSGVGIAGIRLIS